MSPEQQRVIRALEEEYGRTEVLRLVVHRNRAFGGVTQHDLVVLVRGNRDGSNGLVRGDWWYVPDHPTATTLRHATEEEIEAAREQDAARTILISAGLVEAPDSHPGGDDCVCGP